MIFTVVAIDGPNQGIMGRILNFGTLIISGAGNPQPILGISDPLEFRRAFMEAKDQSHIAHT